jgi:sensor histidine kinase YesM
MFRENPFVFSKKYRVARHALFWIVHIIIFSFLFKVPEQSIVAMCFLSTLWVPGFILYGYPVAYWFLPRFLLKGKYLPFFILLLSWATAGYFFNYFYRTRILFPVSDMMQLKVTTRNPWAVNSYLSMNVMAALTCLIVLFKYWMVKQKELLSAEKEKVSAELQLLKAQVHPHFLFNTLNNIYSLSLENSPKTAQMILKLSSLLSYMLYDCKTNQVLLEKEIEIMKNYIDLEKERYGDRLEISTNFEGDVEGKFIAPLLFLPFLENTFKHGTSDQLEKSWISMDVSVKNHQLRCKILNSKNESPLPQNNGIGIQNIQKRLAYLYPGKHELKLHDEGSFFSVSLTLDLESIPSGKNNTN